MLLRENTGLVVIDVQGKLARIVHESASLIAHCETLIKGAKVLELPIILVEHNPEKLGPTTKELSAHLDSIPPITKFTFNACEAPGFLDAVKAAKVDNWLICGIEAHICVYQTAKGLVDAGFNVELVGDCVSSRTVSNAQLGIERMKDIGVAITGLEMCLYELVNDCRHPTFKQILSLVR